MMQSYYDREMAKPMWQELADIGVKPLTSGPEVDQFMSSSKGTVLIVVNSVCGCSASNARPGVALALQNKVIPDNLATVFAGVDREATAKAREYIVGYPPSSPSVALFRDGKLVFMLERHSIEGSAAEEVAAELTASFNEHCTRSGPSVPEEQLKKAFGIA
ncbi:MAG TPA: BrxA/BrxB family bacilliredoxin [candidate division Zixibacteria bacterium]|nr:BrxA/BrxB family bacilliredoxin [candidate division Zixibacteria bacterium]